MHFYVYAQQHGPRNNDDDDWYTEITRGGQITSSPTSSNAYIMCVRVRFVCLFVFVFSFYRTRLKNCFSLYPQTYAFVRDTRFPRRRSGYLPFVCPGKTRIIIKIREGEKKNNAVLGDLDEYRNEEQTIS